MQAAILCVVQMRSQDYVPRTVCDQDSYHRGECIEPHQYKRHVLNDHSGWEDAEQKAASDGPDSIVNCTDVSVSVTDVFIFGQRINRTKGITNQTRSFLKNLESIPT